MGAKPYNFVNIHDSQLPFYNLKMKEVIDEESQQEFPNALKTREKNCCLEMSNISNEAKTSLQFKTNPPSFRALENDQGEFPQSPKTVPIKKIALSQKHPDIVLMRSMVTEETFSHGQPNTELRI